MARKTKPEPLTPEDAITVGRSIVRDQLTPRQLAGIFAAILECDDHRKRDEFVRSLILGIALEDLEARNGIDAFISQASKTYTIDCAA